MRSSILLIGNFLSGLGGPRSISEELSERLRRRGWDILTTSSKPARVARLLDMMQTCWRKRRHYDLAHVEVASGAAFVWAETTCALLRLVGRPYILALHGGNLPVFAVQWPSRVSRLLKSAAVVVAPSRYLFERMQTFRKRIVIIPNGLELSASRFRLRAQPAPRLIWVRSFHAIYNPLLAVKTLAQLKRCFPEIHLTMIGPDKGDGSFKATKALVKRLGLVSSVTFPGGVPKADIPAWLDKADIFINTTNIDNTPVSVLEAMASGLCVVTTDVGGIPYLLHHDQDALLVERDSADAMAAAVAYLLTHSDVAENLSRNARALVEEFDWPVILQKWEALLEDRCRRNHVKSPPQYSS